MVIGIIFGNLAVIVMLILVFKWWKYKYGSKANSKMEVQYHNSSDSLKVTLGPEANELQRYYVNINFNPLQGKVVINQVYPEHS